MINILLEGFDIDAPWLYDELKNYIQPKSVPPALLVVCYNPSGVFCVSA